MLNKKFKTRKEAIQFKKDYSECNITTEVISNILQPYHEDKYPEMKEYLNFKFNDNPLSRKMTALNFFCESYALDLLKDSFGKCDFTFEGNRTYKNYVFEFEGLTFITPAKREVVLSEGKDWSTYIPRIIAFEKTFQQFLLTNLLKLDPDIPVFIKNDIKSLKSFGILSEDNIIDFDYFSQKPKLKP